MVTSDAAIRIEEYDPAWPAMFAAERKLLEPLLSPWLAGSIEHIGSTAVPGLAAKPVIDIMAPVESLDASRDAIAALQALGYHYALYRAEAMHWFCKPDPVHRTHHLHLVPRGGSLWNARLAFRDRLRSDPAVAADYADLKRRLAATHRHDREAYTDAKSSFIEQVARE